ncbi:hypothetical protein RRG08_040086 [Elysia crispata]|uniref:Uncharacterized protein n=1 Tax=Elysia crispata TaxID=231223 RepID=A0AAE0XWF4_9GAST|nr:hypothetical protein RRG08_040086 [Elysia crispata]
MCEAGSPRLARTIDDMVLLISQRRPRLGSSTKGSETPSSQDIVGGSHCKSGASVSSSRLQQQLLGERLSKMVGIGIKTRVV